MDTWSMRGIWGRVLSEYGMMLVLALVCAYYTLATWGVQHRSGAEAAQEALRELPPNPAGVIVVGHTGTDAREFVNAAARGLKERGVAVLAIVRGEPVDLRSQLDQLNAAGTPARTILATQEAADWRVVRNLSNVTVIAPRAHGGADFLRPSNLSNIADRVAVIAIIGIGMTMIILTRGIDLSAGSLIALSAVVAARVIRDFAGGENAGAWGMVLGCAAAVALCAVVGLFSGTMVTVFRVPPFIVTLAIMLMASGVAYELSAGQSINQLPESFTRLGRGTGIFGVPNTVWLMLALYAAAWVLMSRTVAGRYVYAIGGNPEGAYYAAVPVRRTIVLAYVVSAGLAGLGGVVEASRLKSGSPTFGLMTELSVIAAVVVGGTSLNGGRGSVIGTLIGALVIAVIQNGMNLTGVGSYRQQIVLGAVILGAVLLDRLRSKAEA